MKYNNRFIIFKIQSIKIKKILIKKHKIFVNMKSQNRFKIFKNQIIKIKKL